MPCSSRNTNEHRPDPGRQPVAPSVERRVAKIGLIGDLLLARRIDPSRGGLREALHGCDLVFANLECVLHDFEDPPARPSGGTWTRGHPALARDLRALGVRVVSLANNHAGDYGPGAARTTLRHLRAAGIATAGWGESLQDAAAPALLGTQGGPMAVFAATSTFPEQSMAAASRGRIRARAGVNPLRIDYCFLMPKDALAAAQELLGPLGIVREAPTGDVVLFGRYAVTASTSYGYRATVRVADLERLIEGIRAVAEPELVIVSHHVHPGRGPLEEEPDEAQEEVAKTAIDAGASIVAGHGPHTLRPIEFYRHGLICYGLGSLFLESAWTRPIPWDALDEPDSGPLARRGRRARHAYAERESSRWGLIVRVELDGRKVTNVEAKPVVLERGRPRVLPPSKARPMIEHIRRLSEPRGTTLDTSSAGLRLRPTEPGVHSHVADG